MVKRARVRVVGLLLGGIVAALPATSYGQEAPRHAIIPATGLPRGVMPMLREPNVPIGSNFCTQRTGATPHLDYFGGQVLQNPKIYNVNWGNGIAAEIK